MQQSQEPTQIEINFSPNGPSASNFVVETQTNLVNVAPPWHPIDCRDAAHGDTALYRTPRTTQWHPAHRIHPYLQRGLAIARPNHVWAADITYIPMRRGFVYLFAVLDWASRRVLAWRLSNTLTTDFCLEAVQEAITQHGRPEIFNTDQGCQFTSLEFTRLLKDQGIQINMDGRGCWRDNVFVERLWRSLKYEEVYLHVYDTVSAGHQELERYVQFYNQLRPHRALDGRTPDRVCWEHLPARPLPRRRTPPGTTYELAETAQSSGATSEIGTCTR